MVDRLLSDREILIQDGLSYFNGTTIPELKSRSVRKMPYLLNVLLSCCTVQYSVDCVVRTPVFTRNGGPNYERHILLSGPPLSWHLLEAPLLLSGLTQVD